MDIGLKNKKGEDEFNWFMLFLISFVGVSTGIYRDGFSALFPLLKEDFGLTRAQLGLHSTLFFFSNAFATLFTGSLVDLKGSKWGLLHGVFFMGIFCILHSIAPNFTILLLLGALTGLAVSTNLPASAKGIIQHFPQKWRDTAFGIQSTGFPAGGMIGAILLPFLASFLGWRKTIVVPGIIAFLCFLIIFYFYKDKDPNDVSSGNGNNDNTNILPFWKSYGQLLKNKDLISISILGFFLGIANGSIAAHFTIFLYLDYGLSASIAGLGFAIVQLGSILGRLGWGATCDKFLNYDRRKAFLYIGILFTMIALLLGLFLKNITSPIILMVLAFLVGYSGRGWQGLYFASVSETVEDEYVGVAAGFSSVFLKIGIMAGPPIFGYIADIRDSYDLSWTLLGIILFIASVGQYMFHKK